MNIVLNKVHIGLFINSLASSGGLHGNFGLRLKRYGIDLLIKPEKYFMISSAHKPKLIELRQEFTF